LNLNHRPLCALNLRAELGEINSAEEAANWAHRVLDAKNTLTAADAAGIEEAFRAKLAIFAIDTACGPQIPPKQSVLRHGVSRIEAKNSADPA
jgi:hypothetical protein